MTFLPDVNVWLALGHDLHSHHAAAGTWFEAAEGASIAFCRVTQIALLRLLTDRRVMTDDVLTADRAWAVFDGLKLDTRVQLAPETPGVNAAFRQFTHRRRVGAGSWTPAYLATFAQVAGHVSHFRCELPVLAPPPGLLIR